MVSLFQRKPIKIAIEICVMKSTLLLESMRSPTKFQIHKFHRPLRLKYSRQSLVNFANLLRTSCIVRLMEEERRRSMAYRANVNLNKATLASRCVDAEE